MLALPTSLRSRRRTRGVDVLLTFLLIALVACGDRPDADDDTSVARVSAAENDEREADDPVAGDGAGSSEPTLETVEDQRAPAGPVLSVTIERAPRGGSQSLALYVVDPESIGRDRYFAERKTAPDPWAWSFVERIGSRIDLGETSGRDVVEATISAPSKKASLVARDGDAFVVQRVSAARDGALTVRFDDGVRSAARFVVRASSGRPLAGVEVGLARFDEGSTFRPRPGTWRYDLTDDDGAARLASTDRKTVCAHVIGEGLVRAQDAAANELRLPPAGRVVVRVPDEAGRRASVELHHAGMAVATRSIVDGAATFTSVGLNREFEARLVSRTAEAVADLVGPVAGGQVIECELDVAPRPSIALRAVDVTGAPLVAADLEVRWNDVERVGVRVATDDDGYAVAALERTKLPVGGITSVHVLEAGADDGSNEIRVGSVRFDEGLMGPAIECGDVVLGRIPLAVAGTVVDESGAPIEGARVKLLRDRIEEPEGLLGIGGRFGSSFDEMPPGSMERAVAVTGADGAFALRASPQETDTETWALYVEAKAKGTFQEAPEAVQLGETGVEITLSRAGSLELEAPGPAVALGVLVDYLLVADTDESEQRLSVLGRTTVHSLRPGSYSLVVEYGEERLHVIDDVVVRAGETTRDPRLLPIELGAELRIDEIELVDPEGKPVRMGQVWSQTGDDLWIPSVATGLSTRHSIASIGDEKALRLARAEGRGFVLFEEVPADGRVVVPDTVTVQIELTGERLPDREVEMEIVPELPDGLEFVLDQDVTFDRAGRVRVTLPGPATYVLRDPSSEGRNGESPLEPWNGATFEVGVDTTVVVVAAR